MSTPGAQPRRPRDADRASAEQPRGAKPPRGRDRRTRILANAAGALGGLLLIGWLVGLLWGTAGGAVLDAEDTYDWASGSAVYLAHDGYRATQCVVTPAGAGVKPREYRLPASGERPLGGRPLSLTGVKVGRDFTGTAQIRCDHQVTVSSGWVLWFVPLAYTPIPPIVGIVLVLVWLHLTGRTAYLRGLGRSDITFRP